MPYAFFSLVLVLAVLLPGGAGGSKLVPPTYPPDDGRTALLNTDTVPEKYVGALYFEDPRPEADRPKTNGKARRGTAFLVGQKHVVSCAHCVGTNEYNGVKDGDKPYPRNDPKDPKRPGRLTTTDIYFAPGQRGPIDTPLTAAAAPDTQPFGRYKVVKVTAIMPAFFTERNITESRMHDLVVLELDQSTKAQVGGHFAVADVLLNRKGPPTKWQLHGYDGDRVKRKTLPGGEERLEAWQVKREGTIDKAVVGLTLSKRPLRPTRQATLTCKASDGASGGPIWKYEGTTPTASGIIVAHNNGSALGLFFTKKHVEFIQAGIK